MIRKFLLEEAVAGVGISNEYMAIGAVSGSHRKMSLDSWGLLANISEMTSAEITSAVKTIWREKQIPTKTVGICFSNLAIGLKNFSLAAIASEEELLSAINIEAESMFQKPIAELFIDCHINKKTPADNSQHQYDGVLIATPRKEMNEQLDILRKAGLYPVFVTCNCFALANLFLHMHQKNNSIGIIDMGGSHLSIALLSPDNQIYPKEFFFKKTQDVQTEHLIKHIQGMLESYYFRLHQHPIEKLFITGYLSKNQRIQSELKTRLDIEIEFWNPLNDMRVNCLTKKLDCDQVGPILAASLGAGIIP